MTDSFGKHRLEKPPERVVVTDWALLEQLLELGITPVGAPELERYRHYVKQPALPQTVVDIGLRRKPNLNVLRALKPDAIIIGTDQKNLARPFSYIAPVMYYKSFSDKYRTNGKKSRTRFLQLADLFQRRPLAESKLAKMDKELKSIGEELRYYFANTFNSKPPKITLIRFSSNKKVLIYGENSMALHTLEQLGLQSGINIAHSKWGYKEVPIAQLKSISHGIILYIKPLNIERLDPASTLFDSKQWLSIPAVKEQRIYAMEPSWSYGGAMSILYKARAIRNALMSARQF